MSTTEYIIVMSFTSTYGAMLPDAIVETITFGTPDRELAHRRRDHRGAAATAEAKDAVEPLGGECLTNEERARRRA